MSGDNTNGQSIERAYNRLLLAVMCNKPKPVISCYVREYNIVADDVILLEDILRDARNYIIYAQGGHQMLLHRDSPLAKKITNEGDMAQESKDDRILRRKLQNRKLDPEGGDNL